MIGLVRSMAVNLLAVFAGCLRREPNPQRIRGCGARARLARAEAKAVALGPMHGAVLPCQMEASLEIDELLEELG